MIGKKGITYTVIAVMIIALVVFILMLSVIVPITTDISSKANDEICRESVIINSKVASVTGGFKDIALECPATHTEIKERRQEKVNYRIVNELKSCWYKMYGKGNKVGEAVWDAKDDNYCVVCSEFSIQDNGEIEDKVMVSDILPVFNDFDPKTKRPYHDFFDVTWYSNDNSHFFVDPEFEGGAFDGTVHVGPLSEIETEKDHLVVYLKYSDRGLYNSVDFGNGQWDITYENEKSLGEWGREGGNTATYNVFVVPEEDVYKLKCEYLFWQVEDDK